MKVKRQVWRRNDEGGGHHLETISVDIPKIGRFVDLEDFNAHWALFFHREFRHYDTYLPTETVVRNAEVVVPRRGRIFSTDFYLYKGLVVTYDWLRGLCEKIGEKFTGSYSYEEVAMVEVYGNDGSDGHTDYKLVGYRFVGVKALENHDGPDGMMRCMVQGWGDDE